MDYVSGKIDQHVVLGYMPVTQVDAAVKLSVEADKHCRGLETCRMCIEAHITEIAYHDNILVQPHKFGNVLFEQTLYRDFVRSPVHNE